MTYTSQEVEREMMNALQCPWCEAALALETVEAPEPTCPECLTTWCYEEEPVELALAA